ncbi:hypothetical protein [Photobacterium phosphoreum]|uniref:hypothetical protein n=1 Tax=Photobacterium phosphoreum TaxID=659 RepID=UPI000D180443|nr:hypothetical protein [Photobacterium phosphoreum]MCD9481540.1 hypothetical protein [Photobacterium phosphoreum]PSU33499.1 hypothetical protein CTM85_19345 [Photobacterium phosphoreum]
MPTENLLAVIFNDNANFTQAVTDSVGNYLSNLTYADFDIEATSAHFFECDGLTIDLNSVDFDTNNLSVISINGDDIKLSVEMNISIDASADFSLSTEDSIDGDTVSLAGTSETVSIEFSSNVEINVTYYQDEQEYELDDVVVVTPPQSIDFGELEPDYS